ncbi:probable glycosyltransferase STELLO1 [Nematostella vectensis]|uniref:probable glycosyltransferase STELLO1 n=1 Tax=Nematostella vectensis TaxID=45351 RepID=UPI0020770E9C|nr:probable glycosyltransferase STELLO1 [Nematostella vectensis]
MDPKLVKASNVKNNSLIHRFLSKNSCHSYLENVALIIIYHYPYYDSFPLLRSFYENGFRKIIACGPKADETIRVLQVSHERGFWGYECIGKAARLHPGYEGYLQIHDDSLFLWWNVLGVDKDKMWKFDQLKFTNAILGGPIPQGWGWKKDDILNRTAVAFSELRKSSFLWINQSFSIFYKNTGGIDSIPTSLSDAWYVPGRLSKQLGYLSSVFFKHKIHLEAAVPTMICLLDYLPNVLTPEGIYLSKKTGYTPDRDSALTFWKEFRKNITFLHPFKLHGDPTGLNRNILAELIIPYAQMLCYKNEQAGRVQEYR